MFDENPGDQIEVSVPKGTSNMIKLEDTPDVNIEDAQDVPLERSFFWACPKCLTDDYLVDITSVEQLPDCDF